MRLSYTWSLVLAAAAGLPFHTSSRAGEKNEKPPEKQKEEIRKNVIVNGELNNADLKDRVLTQSYCKTYTYKMVKGRSYQIDLQSTNFDAYLRLEDPKGTQVAADDDSGGMLNARIVYRPTDTGDFNICAMSLGGGSTGKFTLTVKDTTAGLAKDDGKAIELKANKGQATFAGNLAQNDPLYKNKRHKLFVFNMEAGKTYQIDMKSKAFDSYLFLESPDGQVLEKDDDSGGFPDAKIVFKATAGGKYRIITTHFGGGNQGEFTLTVRQTDGGAPPEDKKDGDKK